MSKRAWLCHMMHVILTVAHLLISDYCATGFYALLRPLKRIINTTIWHCCSLFFALFMILSREMPANNKYYWIYLLLNDQPTNNIRLRHSLRWVHELFEFLSILILCTQWHRFLKVFFQWMTFMKYHRGKKYIVNGFRDAHT